MPIEYHRNIVSDKVRNEAFRRALKTVIEKDKTVVADIGSGTGIMGFLASRLGAKAVYLYEFADVMGLSQKLAKDNKIKNCHFLPCHSTEIADPPAVDVIVSETLGNYALEENIIATVEDAKRFLKPGGSIIPQSITHFVAPVINDRFYKDMAVWDDVGFGLDFSAAKTMSLNNIYVRTFRPGDLLDGGKSAQAWDTVDFRKENGSVRKGSAEWALKKPATIYGFAVWWTCELVPGINLATAPDAPKTHWEQLYFPVLEPLEAKKGDRVAVTISSHSTYQEGTTVKWRIAHKKGKTVKTQALDLTKGYLA